MIMKRHMKGMSVLKLTKKMLLHYRSRGRDDWTHEEKRLYHLEEALRFKMPTNEGMQEMMDSMEGDELGSRTLKSASIQLNHDLQQDSTLQEHFGQTAFSKTVGNTASSTLNHKRMLESIHNSSVYQACKKGQEMHEWKPDPTKANKPTPADGAC